MRAAKREGATPLGARIKAPFRSLWQFLTDVWFEMKRVVWPSWEEANSFTAVVIIAVAVVAVWVGSLDWIATTLVSTLNLYTNR